MLANLALTLKMELRCTCPSNQPAASSYRYPSSVATPIKIAFVQLDVRMRDCVLNVFDLNFIILSATLATLTVIVKANSFHSIALWRSGSVLNSWFPECIGSKDLKYPVHKFNAFNRIFDILLFDHLTYDSKLSILYKEKLIFQYESLRRTAKHSLLYLPHYSFAGWLHVRFHTGLSLSSTLSS